jgi:hypothetical protein
MQRHKINVQSKKNEEQGSKDSIWYGATTVESKMKALHRAYWLHKRSVTHSSWYYLKTGTSPEENMGSVGPWIKKKSLLS